MVTRRSTAIPFRKRFRERTMKTIFVALTLAGGLFLAGGPARAIEEPAFKTVLSDGAFEVRDYPGLIVAEVTVSGEQKAAASKGFRLLAGYIFGGNRRRQSIAMTAPVAQEPVSEKIAMTAPVTQIETAGTWIVRFTMPRAYTMEALPEPNDPKVRLRRLPAARFAVLRFSGLASNGDVRAKSTELLAMAESHHLHPSGPVTHAQYDPPWTLWLMRRNEVMVPIEP
jgi:hypothetical protein